MLACLRIQNFAIIENLQVEFGPGLNVVTGETGAGKSVLVDAMELVLGARSNPQVVRTGAAEAEFEALFDVSEHPQIEARLEASGLCAKGSGESELLVRRVIQENGRSRAYVNGRLVTTGQLEQLVSGLVDISSQHEHHRLSDPSTHLDFLDAYAHLGTTRARMIEAYRTLTDALAALAEFQGHLGNRSEREDLLRFQVRELEELNPVEGEEETLESERNRLRYAERLASITSSSEDALYSRDSAIVEELGRISVQLMDAARLDATLEPLTKEIDAARSQLQEVARELGRYARNVTVDEARLAEVDERIEKLKRVKKKYGGSIAACLEHLNKAKADLLALDEHESREKELEAAIARAKDQARELSKQLSSTRRAAAKKLGRAISDELASLGMGGAQVEVKIEPVAGGELDLDGARLSSTGVDRAEFLIAPNKGEQARPLRKVASGGELSRAMLAIKRVLAELGPAGMYVFDEVDAGVGGAVAEVIGRKLADVAQHRQVICITHLPQIAVFGQTHYRVQKVVENERTHSTITALSKKDRLEEVARMLGGAKISAKTRAAAQELLREAGN